MLPLEIAVENAYGSTQYDHCHLMTKSSGFTSEDAEGGSGAVNPSVALQSSNVGGVHTEVEPAEWNEMRVGREG